MNTLGRIRNFCTLWCVGVILVVTGFIINLWVFSKLLPPLSYAIFSISAVVIGNLVVIANLARKSAEKRLSKKFANYVLTFYTNVFSKNSIEIITGSLGQAILLVLYWKHPEKYEPYFIIYTLVFFGFCGAPVLRVLLSNLEALYVEAFSGKLARRFYRMEKHYIIAGYGRFGKTVVNDLFENYVYYGSAFESIYSEGRMWFKSLNFMKRISKSRLEEANEKGKPILLLERMLNERCEDILFCINLVIVDKNERLFSNVFSHPNLGKIGVVVLDRLNALSYDKENYKKKVYIPAIVGDAKNPSTLDLAHIDRSKMVLSLLPEEEATLHLFDAILHKQKDRKGIIAGTTTAQGCLLIPQSYDTNISFLHGYRIRGWGLGNIVAGNLINRINNDNIENVKILILGGGRQLHFFLEKMFLEIIWKKEGRNNSFFKDNCLIIGNDEYINNSTITMDGHTYWKHELAYVTNSAVYKRDDYIVLVPYLRGISNEPTLLGPIVSGEVQQCTEQEPFKRVNPEFFKKRPEIIIISSDSREEVLKVFNELNSISKKYHLIPKPAIVAESNPDTQKVVTALNRAHTGVSDLITKYPIPFLNEPYPIEFSENVVKSFEDGKKLVRGYIDAMSKQDGGVILRVCVDDKPGIFVKLCFLLAHWKVNNPDLAIPKGIPHVPSFHNTHILTQRNGYFCFFSDADLVDVKKMIRIEANANHIREVFVSSNNPQNKKWLINEDYSLIPRVHEQPICGSCMGLTFCPICTFDSSIKAESNPLIKREKEMARWKNNTQDKDVPENKRYDMFARVYACCKGSDKSGALAILLHKLMLYNYNGNIDYGTIHPGQLILNLKYVMNVECYNPDFELLRIHGSLEPYDKETDLNRLYEECLEGIVISPVKFEADWLVYSQNLRGKVSNSLFYYDGDQSKPNNILILTREYRDVLLKEYVQFQIEKTVNELNIEGVITKSLAEELKFDLYDEFKSRKMNASAIGNITDLTIGTGDTYSVLNSAIRDYVEARTNKDKSADKLKAFKGFVRDNFEDFKDPKKYRSCLCPIPECPFKSKALYLLIKGTPEQI